MTTIDVLPTAFCAGWFLIAFGSQVLEPLKHNRRQ